MGKSERGQGVEWRVQGVGGVKQAGWRWPARGQQAASTRPCPSVQGGRRQGARRWWAGPKQELGRSGCG